MEKIIKTVKSYFPPNCFILVLLIHQFVIVNSFCTQIMFFSNKLYLSLSLNTPTWSTGITIYFHLEYLDYYIILPGVLEPVVAGLNLEYLNLLYLAWTWRTWTWCSWLEPGVLVPAVPGLNLEYLNHAVPGLDLEYLNLLYIAWTWSTWSCST